MASRATAWLYNSKSWQVTRESYKKSKRGLCEVCLSNGDITPGEIVHHKIHLNAYNVRNPAIALDWNNLELLCRDCHAKQHEEEYSRKKSKKRYVVDKYGNVTAKDSPPC